MGDTLLREKWSVEMERVEEVKRKSKGFSDRIQRGPKEKIDHIYEISLEDIVDGVELGFGIPVSAVRGMSRNRIELRGAVLWVTWAGSLEATL